MFGSLLDKKFNPSIIYPAISLQTHVILMTGCSTLAPS